MSGMGQLTRRVRLALDGLNTRSIKSSDYTQVCRIECDSAELARQVIDTLHRHGIEAAILSHDEAADVWAVGALKG